MLGVLALGDDEHWKRGEAAVPRDVAFMMIRREQPPLVWGKSVPTVIREIAPRESHMA